MDVDRSAAPAGGDDTPPLVYLLDGAGVPQYYLAPYYLLAEGDDRAVVSASGFSLTVQLVVRPGTDEPGAVVHALVAGGSGLYRFAWARRPLDDSDDDAGFVDLGETTARQVRDDKERLFGTTAITVPPGCWLMYLNVKDVETGAFKHHQEMVYTGPIVDLGSAA